MTVAPYLPLLALRVAGFSTGISVVVGLWLAWTLANREFAGKRVLGALSTAALALPSPVLCYYLLCVWGRVWPLTEMNLAAAGVLSAMPLVIRASLAAFASLDPNLAKAARSLGASGWRVFLRIELPLVLRPILVATALAFARVLAELATAFWIASRRP
ncbi:MAG: ABC transporter permease subunit [Bryobacteraceae bacterium]